MNGDFRSDHRHCENRCAYFAGYFDTRGDMYVKIESRDYQFTRMPNTSFAKCLCVSEDRPLRIYQNCCRMLRIIGCGAYLRIEEKKRQERAEMVKVPPKRSPDQTSGDVKESPLWTQVNVRKRGEEAVPMVRGRVTIDDVERRHRLNPDAEYTLEEIVAVGEIAYLPDQDDPCEDMIPDWRDRQ